MKKNTNNSSLVVVLPCPRPLIGPYSYIFFNTAVFLIPPFFAGPEIRTAVLGGLGAGYCRSRSYCWYGELGNVEKCKLSSANAKLS